MSQINAEGYYDVTLHDCHMEETEKGDGVVYVLPCRTAEGQTITAFLYAKKTYIQSGRNQGRSLAEVTLENLRELGLDDPSDVEALNGKPASIKVEEEEYNGKKRMKVAFINPPRAARPRVDKARARAIFADLGIATPATSTAATPPAPAPGAPKAKADDWL